VVARRSLIRCIGRSNNDTPMGTNGAAWLRKSRETPVRTSTSSRAHSSAVAGHEQEPAQDRVVNVPAPAPLTDLGRRGVPWHRSELADFGSINLPVPATLNEGGMVRTPP
jgi:hypothetical protein